MDPYHMKNATAKATAIPEEGSGGGGGVWTEERHASFLNRIEESFVRTMLGGGDFDGCHRALRLDRCLPDSATESTADSRPSSSRSRAPAPAEPGTQNLAARKHISKKRLLQQRQPDSSQDQVVPHQSERTKVDKANNSPKCKKGGNQSSRWL